MDFILNLWQAFLNVLQIGVLRVLFADESVLRSRVSPSVPVYEDKQWA